MGNPEVAWFKSRSRYFSNNKAYKFKIVYNLIIGRIVGINIPLVQKNEFDQKQISPGRIMVLHQIANLDPSGCAGSIPAQGVYMKKEELIKNLENHKFSEKIIRAFEEVDRSKFVLKNEKRFAYWDIALPIGEGQTISQPYTIAFMLTLLEVKDKQKILEVGSGSGYVLELLSKLNPNGKIFGIERIKKLAESSKEKLKNCKNVTVIHGDGSKGFAQQAPFDRILISAASKTIPKKLIEQLIIKGILVAPVQDSIIVVKKNKKKNKIRKFLGFRFVPLIEE